MRSKSKTIEVNVANEDSKRARILSKLDAVEDWVLGGLDKLPKSDATLGASKDFEDLVGGIRDTLKIHFAFLTSETIMSLVSILGRSVESFAMEAAEISSYLKEAVIRSGIIESEGLNRGANAPLINILKDRRMPARFNALRIAIQGYINSVDKIESALDAAQKEIERAGEFKFETGLRFIEKLFDASFAFDDEGKRCLSFVTAFTTSQEGNALVDAYKLISLGSMYTNGAEFISYIKYRKRHINEVADAGKFLAGGYIKAFEATFPKLKIDEKLSELRDGTYAKMRDSTFFLSRLDKFVLARNVFSLVYFFTGIGGELFKDIDGAIGAFPTKVIEITDSHDEQLAYALAKNLPDRVLIQKAFEEIVQVYNEFKLFFDRYGAVVDKTIRMGDAISEALSQQMAGRDVRPRAE